MNTCTIFSHRRIRRVGSQPRRKRLRIPRLHENRPRACELTNQTLPGHHIRYDAAGCDALEDVLAVPRNEVTVVDDVLLVFLQLIACQSKPP